MASEQPLIMENSSEGTRFDITSGSTSIELEATTSCRQLQAIITNPDASVKDKIDAINSDIQLNITLMKLEYEGSLFLENYKRNVPLRKTDTIDQGILKP